MSKLLNVGELAPSSGLYRVTHYQHRMPHIVSVLKDTSLPRCNKCGEHVTFEYLDGKASDGNLNGDADFREAEEE
jgi:hypothetical protein